MNRLKFSLISITVVLTLLCSCKGGGTTAAIAGGDTINFKYAEKLEIVKYDGYTVAKLSNPWDEGKILHTYILVSNNGQGTAGNSKYDKQELLSLFPTATIVNVPLRRAVITTSVHCGLLISLGKKDAIRGICDLRYINIPWIREQQSQGRIADCGSGTTPTLEKIIDINADAVLISPFQHSGGYGRLDEWDKPIIEVADYMETSALGRAEWIKFYGMLFGAEDKADSLFAEIEKNYNQLKTIAKQSNTRKNVIIDKMSGSVWYVPGGNSTIGEIISDANAGYAFSSNNNSGSLPLNFETVLTQAGESDVWMLRYNSKQPATYASLASENQGYSQFKAFKDKQVYGCNTFNNTFYEETPFRPDLRLRDFVIITHPDIKQLGQPRYFIRLK